MRKYSGSTGLKAVPNIPSMFVPRSSPHFVAALCSGKGQQQPQRKPASVHQNPTSSLIHPPKKHSMSCSSNLPMIQVTMEDSEEIKVSSSASPSKTRAGPNLFDTRQSDTAASSANDRLRKISVKERVVLGDTPLGRDLIFRRKISNTSTPKTDKDEEKKRLLLKYTTLNNVPLSGNNSTKTMKNTYSSKNNVQAEVRGINTGVFRSLSKANRAKVSDTNCTARGRTQSLNFQPNAQVKGKTTFAGDQVISYARSRAQSLTFVPNGSKSGNGSSGARVINDKTK